MRLLIGAPLSSLLGSTPFLPKGGHGTVLGTKMIGLGLVCEPSRPSRDFPRIPTGTVTRSVNPAL